MDTSKQICILSLGLKVLKRGLLRPGTQTTGILIYDFLYSYIMNYEFENK